MCVAILFHSLLLVVSLAVVRLVMSTLCLGGTHCRRVGVALIAEKMVETRLR